VPISGEVPISGAELAISGTELVISGAELEVALEVGAAPNGWPHL
jgi:hypothetical protein